MRIGPWNEPATNTIFLLCRFSLTWRTHSERNCNFDMQTRIKVLRLRSHKQIKWPKPANLRTYLPNNTNIWQMIWLFGKFSKPCVRGLTDATKHIWRKVQRDEKTFLKDANKKLTEIKGSKRWPYNYYTEFKLLVYLKFPESGWRR